MPKQYASFLIRWWRLGGGQQRVEVEHVQSGDRTLLDSLRAAFDWVSARGGDPGQAPDPAPRSNGDTEPSR